MPRVVWPLLHQRPRIEIVLTRVADGQPIIRPLLADSGAGSLLSLFELLLEEGDCLSCDGRSGGPIVLGGAYTGSFTSYSLRVQIPGLAFDQTLEVVAVPATFGFAGIACFRFLNRFTYGNFGDPGQFGLETP
jgi:hypothetical protein